MKPIVSSIIVLGMAMGRTSWAEQDELASLKAELREQRELNAKQQDLLTRILQKLEDLERKQTEAPSRRELKEESATLEGTVRSLEENVHSKPNLSGYYSFEYINEDSPAVGAFRQHQLTVFLSKQLNRWNFFSELEFEYAPSFDATNQTFSRGNGGLKVERAWLEYGYNRYMNLRVGKQFFPQYWQVNHFPHLTLSTQRPINTAGTLFPRELVGAMIHGSASRAAGSSQFGVGYNLYVANNQVPDDGRRDQRDGKAWGGKLQFQFPVKSRLKKLDFAADVYNGRLWNSRVQAASDTIWGFDTQIELDRFLLYGEYARGNSLGMNRFGYYLQPAVRLHDRLLAFYRLERVEDPAPVRGGTIGLRHLAGFNVRPIPEISLKLEYFRTLPRLRAFTPSDPRNTPSNGLAASTVFFF